MEHMEKEGVLPHFRVQPKTAIANRLNIMTPGKEYLFCILSDPGITLPMHHCKEN